MAGNADESADESRTKVARVIREYGLEGLGAELEAYWTGTGEGIERKSLRDLADTVNRRLLKRALLEAGATVLDGEIDSYYASLTDGERSEAVRIEMRQRLEDEGVDVDRLESDFVSYQAVRTYLKARGAEYEQANGGQIQTDLEAIQRLLSRTASVSEEKVERLRDTGRIELDEFRLLVNAQVFCHGCDNQYSVQELLERGGCECGK